MNRLRFSLHIHTEVVRIELGGSGCGNVIPGTAEGSLDRNVQTP